jgi:predicted NBD/HSP70 family sugar kinase
MKDLQLLRHRFSSGPGSLLQVFLDGSAHTKAQLSLITGLSRSTVSARVDVLVSKGLLQAAGEAASSGGRPPAQIEFNRRARIVIAADLGVTHGVVAISDLSGEILAIHRENIRIADGPEPVLDWLVACAKKLLAEGGFVESSVAGIGVGVPGPVEHLTGRPTNPPLMPGWDDFCIPNYLREAINLPVLVDNDVNILALGEHALLGFDVDDLVFVKVATGIGAGVISGGTLQRGARGTAGDLGHVQVPYNRSSTRDPKDELDLEAIASGTAIARQLSEMGVVAHTSQDVFELLRSRNAQSIQATRQAGREIGEVLATLVNILNPAMIILGGSIGGSGEELLAGIREVVYHRSTPLSTQNLSIVQSQAGDTGGVVGAAIMVIQRVLSIDSVDALCSE